MTTLAIDHLSHSQITTFTQCPRKWHYDKVEHAPHERKGTALAFGIAIHEALAEVNEAALHGGQADPRGTFAKHWRDAVEDQVVPLHIGKDDPDDLLAKATGLIAAYPAPVGVIGVEQPIEVQLADDLPALLGRVDLILLRDDGSLVLRDLKTSSSRQIAETASLEMQFAIYHEAYPAAQFEAVVLAKLVKPVVTVQSIVPWSRERLVRHVRDVHTAMTAGVKYAVRGWQCDSCPFRDRCRRDA